VPRVRTETCSPELPSGRYSMTSFREGFGLPA
jgi:hypothetical protein